MPPPRTTPASSGARDSAASLDALRRRLAAAGNPHVLRFAGELGVEELASLSAQLSQIDIELLPGLTRDYVLHKPACSLPPEIRPAGYYPRDPRNRARPWDEERFRSVGQGMLREG